MTMIRDNRYDIKSCLIKTDVTAIETFARYILVGIGNVLHVFDIVSLQLLHSGEVLSQFRIHGIRRFDDKFAIFGNRVIVVVSCSLGTNVSFSVCAEWIVGDWIWDVSWTDEDHVLILTANNVVTQWNWKTQQNLRVSVCRSKCLLYCGIILERNWMESVVICGTMFQSIVVWAPSLADTEGCCETIHKLSGHRGAIFSICYNRKLNRISSTSDDRSVKVWQVCFPENASCPVDSWKKATINLLFTIYGHLSRIWKSQLLDDARLITAGEDSQLRIWNENGSAVYHWETHQGASIRSLAVNEEYDLIVTGGGDGGIGLWPLSANHIQQEQLKVDIKFKDLFQIDSVRDVPRRLILSKSKKLLTVTNKGLVLIYHNDIWNCLVTDQRFASYCLFEPSESRSRISLASICGTVIILKESMTGQIEVEHDEKICSGRIFSLQWLSDNSFITCSEGGHLEVWKMCFAKNRSSCLLVKSASYVLPHCRERWLTSAVQLENYCFVGDRDGTVHCYWNQSLHPIQSFRKIHGRLGVSYIWCNKDRGELCSIGRDGYIHYWNLVEHGIEHAAADRLPLKWPCRIHYSETHGLLVLGFNEVNFEVWNVAEKKQLIIYKCGGGHRPWDFSADEHVQFAYIKEKTISNLIVPFDRLIKPSCLKGFHIREINCIYYLEKDVIISGGEDTTLRLSSLRNNQFSPISIIRNHISSVRSISFLRIKDFYIVCSGGGRAQIKLWKVYRNRDLWKFNELGSHMLRSSNRCRKPWKHMIYTYELEPRHMDMKIRLFNKNTVILYVAGSDAFWRVYSFDFRDEILKLEKEIDYISHCILKIVYLNWNSKDLIITMATDGKLTFWDLNNYNQVWQTCIHQNGINSYDYVIQQDNRLVIVTGGDDTAVIFSVFESIENHITLLHQWKNYSTHEAQVSGLAIVNNNIISAGGDQKVVLWTWMLENDEIHADVIAIYYTLIADVHGLDVVKISSDQVKVCLYGAGVEVIEIRLLRHD